MEVFRGNPADPRFKRWLEAITKNRRNVIVIVDDEILCYQASGIIEKSLTSRFPFVLRELRDFRGALIHLISCQNQKCNQLLQILRPQVS